MAIVIHRGLIDDMPRNNHIPVSSGENYADCVFNLISPFDNRFSHVSGTDTITVNNKFKLQFYKGGWDHLGIKALNLNDSAIVSYSSSAGGNQGKAQYVAQIFSTPDLFYVRSYAQDGTDIGFWFLWHTKNDKNFIVFPYADNGTVLANGQIDYCRIACIEDSSSNFKFIQPTTYSLSSPNLLFSDIQMIYGDTGTYSIVDEFKSCSKVNYGSTVSTESKNYYAIGTNILVEAVFE